MLRNLLTTKKRKVAALGTLAAMALAGAAIAYFTASGSGTGSATVGSSTPVTLHGTTAGALYPGTSSQVSFTVDNPSPGAQRVGTIHLVGVSADANHSGCVTSDFTMADVTVNQSFPTGSGQSVTAKGTLSMADNGNQDACQGASLTLSLSST